jgi:hypothetical protein
MIFRLPLTILLAAAAVQAQDQVEIIGEDPVEVPAAAAVVNPKNATLLAANARTLLEHTLLAGNLPLLNDPNFYCIIHVVKWRDAKDPTVQAHNWYVFRGGSGAPNQRDFENKRIYGSSNVGVLYVHIVPKLDKAPAIAAASTAFIATFGESWNTPEGRDSALKELTTAPSDTAKAATARREITDSALLADIKTFLAREKARDLYDTSCFGAQATDNHQRSFAKAGDTCFVKDFLDVAYRVEVTRKLPAPVQSALGLVFSAQTGQGPLKLATVPGQIWSGRVLNIRHAPSDITVQGTLTTSNSSVEIGKTTFDNEGLYRWDISVGIPVKATKELVYDSTSQGVTPKVVEKQNVYALFNFFFKAIDVKGGKAQWIPHPVVGMGITGKPADRTMVGGALGIHKVQGFAGCAFNRVQRETAAATATQPAKLEFGYDKKFIFGINLPVRQVLDIWKKK